MGLSAEILRRYADALEDGRRLENVEGCRYLPEFNQNMLLALNGATGEGAGYALPDAGTVTEWLKERVISISSSDRQSVILGLFYTNRDPFNRKKARITVGVFPLHADAVCYHIRPEMDSCFWESRGQIRLTDESATGNDPFLVLNSGGPDILFFRRSPFRELSPYQAVLPSESVGALYLPDIKLYEEALEGNVVKRALWYVNRGRRPLLFAQSGFDVFIRENRSDPKYAELYLAFTKARFRNPYSKYAT